MRHDPRGLAITTDSAAAAQDLEGAVMGLLGQKAETGARLASALAADPMLAAGHADLVIETNLNDFDIMPLVPIISGAGGIVTNWEGGADLSGGRVVAAGDRRAHEAALKVLAG